MKTRVFLAFLILSVAVPVQSGVGEEPSRPGRVEATLAQQYRGDAQAVKNDFAAAGLPNVHLQFVKMGRPPRNIGIGRSVPAELAREALRLAIKYNGGVRILLPAYLLPPTFITIASSNFDDTVEFSVDDEGLRSLLDPSLATEQFHARYHALTTRRK